MSSNATSGGTKYDAGKTRLDLFPGDVLFAISDILTFGAQKYADRNWEQGMGWGRVFGALMRHMWSWWQGKGDTNENFVFGDLDPETSRSHLWHAGCCMVFLIAYEMRGIGTDDRPIKNRKQEDKEIGESSNTVESGRVLDLQAHVQSPTAVLVIDGATAKRGVVGYDSAGNPIYR